MTQRKDSIKRRAKTVLFQKTPEQSSAFPESGKSSVSSAHSQLGHGLQDSTSGQPLLENLLAKESAHPDKKREKIFSAAALCADKWKDYEIIASGGGEKLERWGRVILLRPDPQAIWDPPFELKTYGELAARYVRSPSGGGVWERFRKLPESWNVSYGDLVFKVMPMGFKHTGLFPEQAVNWDVTRALIKGEKRQVSVLNLFAYTGGATAALAKQGAKVTHVDAAKNMVERAKENCELCCADRENLRFIVDDCLKFVTREIKRGKRYDAVIMDPPSYGRGPGGELWKLEDGLYSLCKTVREVMSDDPLFFLINSYTTGLQPTVVENIASLAMSGAGGFRRGYELTLPTLDTRGSDGAPILLPCGCSGLWSREKPSFF